MKEYSLFLKYLLLRNVEAHFKKKSPIFPTKTIDRLVNRIALKNNKSFVSDGF